MQTRGALRSSPLPERAAGVELVPAGAAPQCGGGGRGESERETASNARRRGPREREGREGGRGAGLAPGLPPPCGRLSAGGYPAGTVPCCRARVGREGRGTGVVTPSSFAGPPLSRSPAREGAVVLSSLSPPRPPRAARPASFGAVSAALPFRFSLTGWGLPFSAPLPPVRPSSSPGARAPAGAAVGAGRLGRQGGRKSRPSAGRPRRPVRRRSSGLATSDQTWRPAEFKHISQRRKRN